jgi:outer membrane biosynthesis protein TonB
MTPTRLLLASCALLCVPAAIPAHAAPAADRQAASAGSGGALADPLRQGVGGGGVAPQASSDAATAELNESPPEGQAAQEPTPTTPEGEQQPGQQQPGEEQPPPTEEQPPPEEGPTTPTEEQPSGAAEGAADPGGGFLPSTGLRIAALVVLGLGLLLAGVTLRPRRGVLR